jgi:glucose-1-phosphate adenylyltransferase
MLDKSILSEGCIVNAKEIKGSVIGIRARIGEVLYRKLLYNG